MSTSDLGHQSPSERLTVITADDSVDAAWAFRHLRDATIDGVTFADPANGEFALAGCASVLARDCRFDLRRPLWNADGFELVRCQFGEDSEEAIWESSHGRISNTSLHGTKALRDCQDISLDGVSILSDSFGWCCEDIRLRQAWLHGRTPLMGSGNIDMENCVVIGGQALQQVRGMQAKSVHLDSEDALWQAKDVTICDSTLQGRRLGWYSEGMTLVNCQIMGGQPLCHCKGLRLIDCVMAGADGAFEDSEVEATLRGKVDSAWVPVSGTVVADIIGEVLRKDGHRCEGRLLVRHSDGTEEDITDRRPSPSA